jgi:methylthioribose-1-phosphate isomerase
MLTTHVRTLHLEADGVHMVDQTALPQELRIALVKTVDEMIHAIKTMVVRGAPAIGIAGAFGVVLSLREHLTKPDCLQHVQADVARLREARPTAVNLAWALDVLRPLLEGSPQAVLEAVTEKAQALYAQDIADNMAMGRHGASLISRKGACLLTHCNAGALATAGYGTALGVIRALHEQDPTISVFADETRPRLQGARLTAWELVQEGIPVTVIPDNMSATLMRQGRIDAVVVGADRIAANGDTANKIGTYGLALIAKAHGVPFYVAAPHSTFDLTLPTGDGIPIEERPADEVFWIHDASICPEGVNYYNPSFDVTPAELVTAFITEKGVIHPPYPEAFKRVFAEL